MIVEYTMTVAELIEHLEGMPKDYLVIFDADGYLHDVTDTRVQFMTPEEYEENSDDIT